MQHFIRKGPPFGSSSEPDPRYVVELSASQLSVTCGRFRLSTPRSNVASARPVPWTGKGGWRLQRTHVALIGSRDGVVEVSFREPVPHRVLRIFPVRWRRLVVSMAEPDAFLADLAVPRA